MPPNAEREEVGIEMEKEREYQIQCQQYSYWFAKLLLPYIMFNVIKIDLCDNLKTFFNWLSM